MNRGLLCLLLAVLVHAVLLWPKQSGKTRLALQGGRERTVDLVPLAAAPRAPAGPRKASPEAKPQQYTEPSGVASPPTLPFSRVIALGNEAPSYPERAVENGWEGDVELRLQLASVGEVEDVSIVRSSGFLVLDDAARRAALRWKLPPGPVAYRVRVEFRLQ